MKLDWGFQRSDGQGGCVFVVAETETEARDRVERRDFGRRVPYTLIVDPRKYPEVTDGDSGEPAAA